ncbi:MAG: ATP-binding protein [Pseudomonadota bacterium]
MLDRSFVAALEQAQRDRLEAQLLTLLAVAEPDANDQLRLPYDLPEVRLNTPASGLYADIRDAQGRSVWQSRSALGLVFDPQLALPEPGQQRAAVQFSETGETLQTMTLGVVWEFNEGVSEFSGSRSAYFAVTVRESRASIQGQLAQFRRNLYWSFGAVAGLILLAMGALLGWLLRPLGRIENEIEAIEQGHATRLSKHYPNELTGVARNLNALLDAEQRRTQRYQETLANLAHSLKTPLAAARALVQRQASAGDNVELQQQLDRMQDIVRYQLSRPAASSADSMLHGRIDVVLVLNTLLSSLDKVYADKTVSAQLDAERTATFRGESGDLLEILGNVLDNAYKWCTSRVLVRLHHDGCSEGQFRIDIDDDGPGFPTDGAEAALTRGHRLDEATPGSGIGLSVVYDLVRDYGGDIQLLRSDQLGGARVALTLGVAN